MVLAGKSGRENPSEGMLGVRIHSARTPALRKSLPAELEAVFQIGRQVGALDGENAEIGVADVGVGDIFNVPATKPKAAT